jgi:hypothetical protein
MSSGTFRHTRPIERRVASSGNCTVQTEVDGQLANRRPPRKNGRDGGLAPMIERSCGEIPSPAASQDVWEIDQTASGRITPHGMRSADERCDDGSRLTSGRRVYIAINLVIVLWPRHVCVAGASVRTGLPGWGIDAESTVCRTQTAGNLRRSRGDEAFVGAKARYMHKLKPGEKIIKRRPERSPTSRVLEGNDQVRATRRKALPSTLQL